MIVVGGKQHCPVIIKGGKNRIDDGHRLAGAGRPLDIGEGIAHGMVHRQQLIQIDLPAQERHRHCFCLSWPLCQLTEEGSHRHCDPLLIIHGKNAFIFRRQVEQAVSGNLENIGHIIHDNAGIGYRDDLTDFFRIGFEIIQKIMEFRIQE